jgi:EcsC protein family
VSDAPQGLHALERLEGIEQAPAGLWDRIRAQPDRAPEYLALAAAEQLAPGAARWVAEDAGRHAPPELAKLAVKKHVRMSRLEGAAAGLAGAWGIVPDLAALVWIQSRMVFHVAASHGFDPRHPMRPAELLTLQGIYDTANDARAALDGLGTHMALRYASVKASQRDDLAKRLIKLAGRKAGTKAAGKVIPGIASPIMAVQNASATQELGQRTLDFYGG